MKVLIAVLLSISLFNPAFGQSLPFPGPGSVGNGVVPIGTPTSLGTHSNADVGSTAVLTTTAAIVSGDLVFIGVALNSLNAVTVSNISDGTNTYTKATSVYRISTQGIELWYKANASAVGSGASVTVTFSGALGDASPTYVQVHGVQVSGIITSSPNDKNASNSGVGTTFTATTATLSQANEIAFGWSFNFAAGAYTPGTGFTSLTSDTTHGGAGIDYKIVAATTAVAFNPTWAGGGGMNVAVATFKGN